MNINYHLTHTNTRNPDIERFDPRPDLRCWSGPSRSNQGVAHTLLFCLFRPRASTQSQRFTIELFKLSDPNPFFKSFKVSRAGRPFPVQNRRSRWWAKIQTLMLLLKKSCKERLFFWPALIIHPSLWEHLSWFCTNKDLTNGCYQTLSGGNATVTVTPPTTEVDVVTHV